MVTGEEHRFLVTEQLHKIDVSLAAALLEPVVRNTAPAFPLVVLATLKNGDDPALFVTRADQTVADSKAFNGPMHEAYVRRLKASS